MPRLIRLAIMDATERREYERELVLARHRAEVAQDQAVDLARTLQDTMRRYGLLPETPIGLSFADARCLPRETP